MENEFEGTVEDVSEKPNKNGVLTFKIKLGGKVYSGFGKAPCKKGDRVHFEYTQNEQWLNIVKDSLEIVSGFDEPPIEEPKSRLNDEYDINLKKMNELKELRDKRNSCLMRAIDYHKEFRKDDGVGIFPTVLDIIQTAKEFEKKYIYLDE